MMGYADNDDCNDDDDDRDDDGMAYNCTSVNTAKHEI